MSGIDTAEIIRRADRLKAERGTFESHWEEVARYIFPSREFAGASSPGRKRMAWIFNTAPVLACEQLAGGLHGMLTSPALNWFDLTPTNTALKQDAEAMAWFADATERMHGHFNSAAAGFNSAAHELYMDNAAFGTGVMYVRDNRRAGPVYQAIPLAECLLAEGEDGRIDTLFRCMKMAARVVLRMWPKDTPESVRKIAEKTPDAMVEIVHAVYPLPGKDRWQEAYVLRAGTDILEQGVYREFPFIAARWTKRSGETYGNGAGMNALPDVKLLNKLEETNLRAALKAIDPPLQVPDDGFLNTVDTRPGGINTFRAGMLGENDRITPILTGSRPDIGAEMIRMYQDRIEAIFYSRWMNLPSQPNMTATEVIQRRDEMLRLLGPMVSRLEAEFLSPLITRTFRIMWDNGLFLPAPASLEGADWMVEYLGPLSISQKSSNADSVIRWFQVATQMAQVDPSVLDAMDLGEAARYLADCYNAPPVVMRSRAAADQRAQQRQQAMQVEQEAAAAEAAARIAKTGAGAVRELSQAQQPQAAPA